MIDAEPKTMRTGAYPPTQTRFIDESTPRLIDSGGRRNKEEGTPSLSYPRALVRGQNRLTTAKLREAWSNAECAQRTITEAREMIERDDISTGIGLLVLATQKIANSKTAIEEAAKLLRDPEARR